MDETIVKSILDHINAWNEKPCAIRLEEMTKKPTTFSMVLQQLSGTVIERKYVDGSFIGAFPFAVYIRFPAADTAKHVQASGYFQQLEAYLRSTALPDIGQNRTATTIDMTTLPSVAGIYEDGSADYQAVFRLQYKQRSA